MKILIADDHALFREIVVEYILKNFESEKIEIFKAKNFNDCKDAIDKDKAFDLVILDLQMPGMRRLEGLRELRSTYEHIPLAVMSGVSKPEVITEALEIGAVGYFPKTLSPKAMVEGIAMILAGERFIPVHDESSSLMPTHFHDDNEHHGIETKTTNDFKLTPREKEVLGYLLQGLSNKEIANDLGLQLVTVKLHVRGICQKLGADNRTQAALKAKELRLLP